MKIALKDFINSTRGKYAFSVLLGLGLATLFRKACNSRDCLVFKAPTLSEIKTKIFKHNDECYKFEEQTVTCNENAANAESTNDDPMKSYNTIINL